MMARGGQWSDSNLSCICPVCERQIDIFNDDVHFSMELHMQSHEPFEIISEERDNKVKGIKLSSNYENNCVSTFYCPQCKEDIKIFNNDISTSLRIHSQKHNSDASETLSADQLSTSSSKSKGSFTEDKYYSSPRPLPMRATSMLDTIFGTMPQGLKSHRGYIIENSNGRILCYLCNVQIEHVNSISDHLKTKLHEDNIILLLRKVLPDILHQIMEFVSFYGSNLCCNLCRCKIDLCSTNPHETIVNIMAHNTSKTHLSKKSDTEPSYCDKAFTTVKSLAQINPLIDENKHFIYCKIEPQLKCTLCENHIEYNQKDNELLKNLTAHFTSKVHKTCLKAISILESFKSFHFPGKETHNFVLSQGSIWCTVCKCSVEVNLETLVSHVKEINYIAPKYESLDLSSRISNMSLDTPSTRSNCTVSNDEYVTSHMPDTAGEEITYKKIVDLNMLLKSLPAQFQNISYVVQNGHGQVTCLICKCVIPASTYNLKTHLMGNNHKTKEQTNSFSNFDVNQSKKATRSIPSLFDTLKLEGCNTTGNGNRKYSTANDDVLLDTILKTDPVIKKNVKQYLVTNNDHYSCNICNSNIQRSYDEDVFKQNLLTHFCAPKHKKRIFDIQNSVVMKLLSSNSVAKANKKYLKIQGENIVCVLCKCSISLSVNEESLKTNLLPHLTGKKHKTELQILNCGVSTS